MAVAEIYLMYPVYVTLSLSRDSQVLFTFMVVGH